MTKYLWALLFLVTFGKFYAQPVADTSVVYGEFLKTIEESIQLYRAENSGAKNYDSIIRSLGYESEQIPTFSDSIYCIRLSEMNERSPFQFDCDPSVLKTIRFFNTNRRGFLKIVLGRAPLYFGMYEEALDRYNMPLELKYLSVIESGLRPQVRSRAGALGLWQFMYGTGKMYGLREDSYIDERMDPYKATDAACRYLKRLYDMYSDWNMALAAYNAGPGNINKAIRRSGGKMTYWGIRPYLPRETQGYVPNFVAMAYILEHAPQHNLTPAPVKVYPYHLDTVCLQQGVHMKTLDSLLDWSLEDIHFVNPIYKTNYIPKTSPPQCISMPIEKIGKFIKYEDSLYKLDSSIYILPSTVVAEEEDSAGNEIQATLAPVPSQYHKVKSGETLGQIAERYHVTVSQLMSWNYLRSSNIQIGQTLSVKSSFKPVEPKTANATSSGGTYTIRSGDNLWNVAQRHGTTISAIQQANPGISADNLKVGQKIKLP